MSYHQAWPYPVRLPPQIGLIFNIIDRIEVDDDDVVLVLRTRPLPSFRYVFWWCEPVPELISFPLPDDRAVGHYWTSNNDVVTLNLFPEDVLIVPLQRPKGKWHSASTITCHVVTANQKIAHGAGIRQVYDLARDAFAALLSLHQNKAIVTATPRAGRLHSHLDTQDEASPANMQ